MLCDKGRHGEGCCSSRGIGRQCGGIGCIPGRDRTAILGHDPVGSEQQAQRACPDGRAAVPDLFGVREIRDHRKITLLLWGQKAIPGVHGDFQSVELRLNIDDCLLAESGAEFPDGVPQELVGLGQDHPVHTLGNALDGRDEIHVPQLFEGQGFLTVLDDEGCVEMLIQGDRNIRRRGILILDGVGVPLALHRERSRTMGIHDIPVVGDGVIEIAIDEVQTDRLSLKNHQGFLRPDLRIESIEGVVENWNPDLFHDSVNPFLKG